jgi:two-component system CheB/CheR fusion protein
MKVVGIGASAGGLEAMTELLSELPDNTGAAYVFVQHLAPDSKSMIGELLSRHTDMPVSLVYESKPIMPNHIYVMPENKDLLYAHGILIAEDRDRSEKLHLPIDKFFHALGENLKEDSIAILLSGTGTDGTRGLRTIKEKGGIILIQDPASAKFDGMPRAAINLKIADQIMPAGEIGKTIKQFINKREALKKQTTLIKKEDSHPAFENILRFISDQSGVDFLSYRPPTLLRRLENRMVLLDIEDIQQYYVYLKENQDEVQALFNDFLIGVTRFFRDPEAFEVLKNEILPKIFEQKKPDGIPYRFWIPACSTGEEAYSIAMLVDQYINTHNLKVDFKIFASDVDEEAIKFATNAVYSYSLVADTPYDLMAKYFKKDGDILQVKPFLRQKVLFAVQNLLGDPPFIHMDLISCRNFLIYLKASTQQNVLATFHFALNEGGFLFLGPSESLGDLKYAFTRYTRRWNIFTKHTDAKVNMRTKFNLPSDGNRLQSIPQNTTASNMTNFDHNSPDPFTQYLVERFAPISLFVNKDLDILYMNGDVEKLLNMPRALARLNLNKMLPPDELMTFKSGVEEVLEQQNEITYSDALLSKEDQKFRADIRFDLPQLSGIHNKQDFFKEVILIELRQFRTNEDERATQEGERHDHHSIKVENLRRELRSAKRQTQDLINDLESANEELQTSNRELLASNEELQSTNEELQSVNEELYTVNSELQIKNEELITANNDINNLLKSTEIGTIFLDKELKIRKFTPAVRKQFKLLDSDIGRSITNFSSAFETLNIEEICKTVFETLSPFEREVEDKSGVHYLVRILPYRTEKDNIDGLVISFVNVEKLVLARKKADRLAGKYRAIFNNSYHILAVLNYEGQVRSMNRPMGPYHQDQLVGNNLFKALPEELNSRLKASFDKVLETKETQSVELKLGFNQWYEVCFIPSHLDEEDDDLIAILLMAQDITEQKNNLLRLRDSLKEYESFMDHASQQIALVNNEGKIHYINRTRYTGKSKENLIGQSIFDYIPKDKTEEYKAMIKDVFNGKPIVRMNFEFNYEGGEKGKAELVATPVILDGVIKYVAIAQSRVELD